MKGMNNMKVIDKIALALVIIGAINWLLIGIFNFNLVDTIFVDVYKRQYYNIYTTSTFLATIILHHIITPPK